MLAWKTTTVPKDLKKLCERIAWPILIMWMCPNKKQQNARCHSLLCRPISQVFPGEILATFSTHWAAFSRSRRVPCGAKKGVPWSRLTRSMHVSKDSFTNRMNQINIFKLLPQLWEELEQKTTMKQNQTTRGSLPHWLQNSLDKWLSFYSAAVRRFLNPEIPEGRPFGMTGSKIQIAARWWIWAKGFFALLGLPSTKNKTNIYIYIFIYIWYKLAILYPQEQRIDFCQSAEKMCEGKKTQLNSYNEYVASCPKPGSRFARAQPQG